MWKSRSRFSRLGVLAPAALSACIDASVLAAPAASAVVSTVLKELSKAFMLKKWFYGAMTAQEAEKLLLQKGRNGSYLVRESQSHSGQYVLSVRVKNGVSHVMIQRQRNKYNVEEEGENFDDLIELIEHCRAYPLTETTSGVVIRLTQPLNERTRKKSNTMAESQENGACGGAAAPPQEQRRISGIVRIKTTYNEQTGTLETKYIYRGFYPTTVMILDPTSIYHILPSNLKVPLYGFYGKFEGGSIDAEFSSLRLVDRKTFLSRAIGNLKENSEKNRYHCVIPYDQTRVCLPKNYYGEDWIKTDYINASFIKPLSMLKDMVQNNPQSSHSLFKTVNALMAALAAKKEAATATASTSNAEPSPGTAASSAQTSNAAGGQEKFYIATQGCLRGTRHAFWAMIAHFDIRIIAMITEVTEFGIEQCDEYWPDEDEKLTFHDITVLGIRVYKHPYYKMRELEVSSSSTKKSSTVYLYQYLDWKDHAAPDDTKTVLRFIRDINLRMDIIKTQPFPPKNTIICVHCSAGIGRTGCFIALDMLIDFFNKDGHEKPIDVYGTVKLLRTQRRGMVTSVRQYKFIYDGIHQFVDDCLSPDKRPKPPYVSY